MIVHAYTFIVNRVQGPLGSKVKQNYSACLWFFHSNGNPADQKVKLTTTHIIILGEKKDEHFGDIIS